MSVGCLCTCGHRTPQHEFYADGTTPCTECACDGFAHADDDPLCESPELPKNKTGRVDMNSWQAKLVQLFESVLGPRSAK